MSLPQKVTVPCPNCKTPYEATIWNTVNTDLKDNLPEEIISGKFFVAKCPHCGHETHLVYDMLYHDMRHSVMIWVVNNTEEAENKIKEIRETGFLTPNYTTRIVRSIDQLREKVAIIEAGRDDRLVEIQKGLLYSQVSQDFPGIQLEDAAYVRDGSKEFLVYFMPNGEARDYTFEADSYKKIAWQFEDFLQTLPIEPYEIIDYKWGIDIMTHFYEYMSEEAKKENLTVEQLVCLRTLEKENEEIRRKSSKQNSKAEERPMSPPTKKKPKARKDEFVPGLGMKWFTFYTKVRPIIACIIFLVYTFAYLDTYATLVNFALVGPLTALLTIISIGSNIAYVILLLILAYRASESGANSIGGIQDELFKFIRGFLIFETIYNVYSYALGRYYTYGKEFVPVATATLLVALLYYFVWYRLNIRYFKRRHAPASFVPERTPIISSVETVENTAEVAPVDEATVREGNAVATDIPQIKFCRKCGSRLIEGARFCSKCGTEVTRG